MVPFWHILLHEPPSAQNESLFQVRQKSCRTETVCLRISVFVETNTPGGRGASGALIAGRFASCNCHSQGQKAALSTAVLGMVVNFTSGASTQLCLRLLLRRWWPRLRRRDRQKGSETATASWLRLLRRVDQARQLGVSESLLGDHQRVEVLPRDHVDDHVAGVAITRRSPSQHPLHLLEREPKPGAELIACGFRGGLPGGI
jgi:hypothetical protein